jgi:hydroxymethylbilane synthase
MSTTGDHILDKPLSEIGSKALFTKELEESLLANEIDFIVHSLKDLPTSLPSGCCIGAILKREDPNDCLVLKKGLQVKDPMDLMKKGTNGQNITFGTSSLRRIAQIKHHNPEARVADIRGNLNTRLSKLDNEETPFDVLILACAGLIRGEFGDRISKSMRDEAWYYAVGQGALAIESRVGDEFITDLLQPLMDYPTVYEALAERSLMFTLEGGCSVPIGVKCSWTGNGAPQAEGSLELTISGAVFALDGSRFVHNSVAGDLNKTEEATGSGDERINLTGIMEPKCPLLGLRFKNSAGLGRALAGLLRDDGALDILNEIRSKSTQSQTTIQ